MFWAPSEAGNLEMFPIPADAPPGQFAGFARIFLLELPFNSPVVGKIEFAPAVVVKSWLCVGDIPPEITFRLYLRRIGGKPVAGGQNPGFDIGITQGIAGTRGIALDETPIGIEGEALANGNGRWLGFRQKTWKDGKNGNKRPPCQEPSCSLIFS